MSNKATCPACGSHTSAIWMALKDETECPYCGLSAAAMVEFTTARKRGADEHLVVMAAKAEARADKAESEVRKLEALLDQIAYIASRSDDGYDRLADETTF